MEGNAGTQDPRSDDQTDPAGDHQDLRSHDQAVKDKDHPDVRPQLPIDLLHRCSHQPAVVLPLRTLPIKPLLPSAHQTNQPPRDAEHLGGKPERPEDPSHRGRDGDDAVPERELESFPENRDDDQEKVESVPAVFEVDSGSHASHDRDHH